MSNVEKHMELLGLRVEDQVTGFKGVVTSISFDLYGCVQAVINPGMNKDGKLGELLWFDVSRLKVLEKSPVMQPPNFGHGPQAEGLQGAEEKPAMGKP